jgi:hypothetical protein
MNANEVGKRLVALLKEHKNNEAINELYSNDIVSVEGGGPPGMDRTARGIDAIRAKGAWWQSNHVVHSGEVFGPFPHGEDKFAVRMVYDITAKHMGDKRFTMEEIAVFQVAGDKIVREEFFYDMG